MIRSYFLRILLIGALLAGVWLILAGWSTDSPRDRLVEASISVVVVLFAVAIALPARASWALRVVAGTVGAAYLLYFGSELWSLLGGKAQSFRIGQPSALMAALGLLIIGIPMLVFAFAGIGVGILEHLMRQSRRGPHDAESGSNGPAA